MTHNRIFKIQKGFPIEILREAFRQSGCQLNKAIPQHDGNEVAIHVSGTAQSIFAFYNAVINSKPYQNSLISKEG